MNAQNSNAAEFPMLGQSSGTAAPQMVETATAPSLAPLLN
jgi:hypothetical protein